MGKFYEIDAAQDRVKYLKRCYLERFGWVSTCNTPGSFWLWRKDFKSHDEQRLKNFNKNFPNRKPNDKPDVPTPYGIITCGLDLAVAMTSQELDQDPYGELEDEHTVLSKASPMAGKVE